MADTLTLAYYGCTSPHNLRPLLDLIRASNRNAKIVVHRDRDYLTTEEAKHQENEIRKMTAEPFLTDGVSVESHFLNAKHLAELNAISEEEMQTLLDVATAANEETSIEKYVNGRSDVERKAGTFGKLNLGQLAAAAPKIVNGDPKRYRDSQSVLKRLRQEFKTNYQRNLRVMEKSPHLAVDDLVALAKKLRQQP